MAASIAHDHTTTRPHDHTTTIPDCVRVAVNLIDRAATIHRVRFLLGGILLVAAALKSESLFASSATLPWYLAAVLVLAELALAGFLFSGAMPLHTWWAAVLCFSCFALVAGVKAWRGEADCGCFGAVATPPSVALAIDVSALGALLLKYRDRSTSRQTATSSGLSRLPMAIGLALIAVVGMKAVVVVSSVQPTLAAVDPTAWAGQRLPLLDDIDVGDEMAAGRWEILFHRGGCGQCEDVLDKLAGINRGSDARRLAIILLSQPDGIETYTRSDSVLTGNLHGGSYGMIPTPLFVRLTDGVVEDVVYPADVVTSIDRHTTLAYARGAVNE